jgi:hypothetical protein
MPVGVDYREEMPTYSDPVELEAARIKSTLTSTPPPAVPPSQPAAVLSERELSGEEMVMVYELRFGGFDRVPTVVVRSDQLASHDLDSRASMLLPFLDGRSSIRNILDLGVVNALDALAGLAELLERGVIGFKG